METRRDGDAATLVKRRAWRCAHERAGLETVLDSSPKPSANQKSAPEISRMKCRNLSSVIAQL